MGLPSEKKTRIESQLLVGFFRPLLTIGIGGGFHKRQVRRYVGPHKLGGPGIGIEPKCTTKFHTSESGRERAVIISVVIRAPQGIDVAQMGFHFLVAKGSGHDRGFVFVNVQHFLSPKGHIRISAKQHFFLLRKNKQPCLPLKS